MNIKLLDCTLRDGGYYNAWDFDPKTVQAYLNAMHALPADLVEIDLDSEYRSVRSKDSREPLHTLENPSSSLWT
jgi:isopropylmalate/homocitrate/citramalate synthase